MKVVFYGAPGKFRELGIQQAIGRGVSSCGDDFRVETNSTHEPVPADVAMMVGMKATGLRERCLAAGQRVIVIDKGYDRKEDWWRVSVDRHQPTDYLMSLKRPTDRRMSAGWKLRPWRAHNAGRFVLITGGGAKYHSVWNLEPPAQWATDTFRAIRAAGWQGEIQYRPKPSQPDKTVPTGCVLSKPKAFVDALEGCHAIVTYGSNACFEAMCRGVPSIVTGDAVMRPISSTLVTDVRRPYLASEDDRRQILSALAYCQFREREWSDGTAWPEMRRQLDEVPSCAA